MENSHNEPKYIEVRGTCALFRPLYENTSIAPFEVEQLYIW